MPLIQLEVENFKSYRGKQVLGPFDKFTAVIGPNGSGKSNLMDAISFVLGIRSAQLRSTQLRDLIYRGRRAEGAGDEDDSDEDEQEVAKTANVTAVFEDSIGKQHRFQRSITSSGTSEYRLNGRMLNASTYINKLQGFNILVKAKNFLVFQGDVEAIASQNAKDLCRLVDQISGSLEHKDAYDAAKAAQQKAEENSTFAYHKRRGIDSELKQFREQKSEAEKFERLQLERDEHVLRHLLWRLYHIEQGIETGSTYIGEQNAKLPSLRNDLREREQAVEVARREQAKTAKDLIKEQRSLSRREKELEAQLPGIDALDEKIAHAERKATNAGKICTAVERDVSKYQASVSRLELDYERAKEAADQAAEEQRQAQTARGLTLSDDDLTEYHNLRGEANLRAISERQMLESLSRDIRSQRAALKDAEEKLSSLQRQEQKLSNEADALTERKTALTQRSSEIEESLKSTRSRLESAQEQRSKITEREIKANEELQICLNKILDAKNQKQASEREAKVKATLRTLKDTFHGVRGRLLDLCQPTQQKYDLAVTTVLGRNADAIIVDSEKTAIDCIEYLRNQRAGQATFIPLDTAQVKPINDRLRSVAKGARLAIDVVQFDTSLERAMQYACGNALVCDTIDVARNICYEKKQEVKAVTLEGTVFHKQGLITGGQTGEERVRRFEDHEIEGLNRQRDQLLGELKDLGKQRFELARDDKLVARVGRYDAELSTLRDELSSIETRLSGAQDEHRIVNQQISETSPKKDAAQTTLQNTESEAATLQAVANQEDDAVFAQFCGRIRVANIREYEERQLKVMQQQSDARLEFERQMKRLEHQTTFERRQLQEAEARLALNRSVITREEEKVVALKSERQQMQDGIEEINNRITENQARIEELKAEDASRTSTLAEARKMANRASKALETVHKDVTARNDELEKLATERSATYRRCRLEEIKLPLLKGSLGTVPLEDLAQGGANTTSMDIDEDETQQAITVSDYNVEVDFSDLDLEEREDGSETIGRELQGRIDEANEEIERMTPNLKAVQRLDDTENKLKETEAEFDQYRNEVREAREEFARIRQLRCDLFKKAFTHIESQIDPVYKDLTRGKGAPNGGRAYLTLEDSDEPYNAGLKYHVMPPLKRFREIEELSGGERTMAALALLFAIHSYQPAPFFVLDEVDAALDSTNVAKVASYIRSRASNKFQFIVISLKASLYERSSSLVGVLRNQELNSSATLTLNLEQYA